MTATLDVTDLHKQFSIGRPAIDGVSFAVPAGEIVVLLGPSGCGKTTTLALRRRSRAPDRGHASVIGGRVVSSPARGVLCRRGCATSAWCSSPTRSGRT